MCDLALSVYNAALVEGLRVTPVLVSAYTSVCNYLKLLGNKPRGLICRRLITNTSGFFLIAVHLLVLIPVIT